MNIDPAQATAYIINPLAGRKVNFAGLFQTHPPTAERIARLRGCASQRRSQARSSDPEQHPVAVDLPVAHTRVGVLAEL